MAGCQQRENSGTLSFFLQLVIGNRDDSESGVRERTHDMRISSDDKMLVVSMKENVSRQKHGSGSPSWVPGQGTTLGQVWVEIH